MIGELTMNQADIDVKCSILKNEINEVKDEFAIFMSRKTLLTE